MPDIGLTKTRVEKRVAPGNQMSAPDAALFRVMALGASAGGLEACNRLLDASPAPSGMAFILVPHLHPTHQSLLVQLLA